MLNRFAVVAMLFAAPIAHADKAPAKAEKLVSNALPTKIDEMSWLKWRLLATELIALRNQHDLAVATAHDTESMIKQKSDEQVAMKERLMVEFKFAQTDKVLEDGTITRGITPATPVPAKTAKK